MSTRSRTSAERFDEAYPEHRADRRAWLERRLRVSRGRLLRRMGRPDADGQSWHEMARAHAEQAERAEHLLSHSLASFDHDPERAGACVRDFGQEVTPGVVRLPDHVPGRADNATPEAVDGALLWSLRSDGPNLLPVIARLRADRPAAAERTTPRPGV